MKTFIADIIPKIQRFSQRLDDLTKLTNQHWVSLGDINESKRVFIFRANNQLLIADNGIVEKGSWEYLGNQSLLISTSQKNYLLKQGFFDENVIALKIDSTNSYAFFVNETNYHKELNNIDDILRFLENKYLRTNNTVSQTNSFENEKLQEYKESEPSLDWDIVKGKHYIIQIIFADKTSYYIYQGFKTKKYFYIHSINGITYCSNKDDCIQNSYNHNRRRI
jgi:hypothetical protein